MKVAIFGAGLSGLSCAITLEKHGVNPSIFEKRSCVGDRFVNAEAMFSILERPVKDGLSYLSEVYGIHLEPISETNHLMIHSLNGESSVEGKIGYTNIRGRHENSFENQLSRQVKSKINFNFLKEYTEISKDFDSIVLATGDGDYSIKLNNYRCDITCSLKGATVEGTFLTSEPHVWFNYDILPKGYAWLIPYSQKEANLVIAFPEYPQAEIYDIDKMWKLMFDLACRDLRQSLKITDRFQIIHYIAGICESPKIGNTYFVGNCFGALSPGLGFGQFSSILTGIYAALDICNLAHYDDLVKPLFENYNHSLALRRFLEGLSNDDLDRIVKRSNLKFADTLISRLLSSDSSFDLLKWLTPLLSK
ncbi:NAD(P)-binding protein [Caproicibacter sp.]|uniref:NAD(P)-binding protein n=1 Tax=Caproicibacter sp. TaxID=2814884 RepID=UPI003989EED2